MRFNGVRTAAIAALAIALLAPERAEAQFSALGGRNIRANAPMFTESAVVHEAGGFSAGAYFAWFLLDEDEFFGEGAEDVSISAFETGFGAVFGVTDRITLGATVPYLSTSIEAGGEDSDVSGIGDLDIFGRAQLWNSANGATRLAALGTVTLATADDGFFEDEFEIEVDRSPSYRLGGGVSHDAGRASVHGSVQYTFAGDVEVEGFEADGTDVLSFTGAGVVEARPGLLLIAEAQVDSYRVEDEGDLIEDDDDTETTVAAGVRWSASPNLFLDGAVGLPLSDDTVTAVLIAGLTWMR